MQLLKKKNHRKFKKKYILVIGELIKDRSYNITNIGRSLETNNHKYFIDDVKEEMGGAGKVYQSVKKIVKKKSLFITSIFNKSKFPKDRNILFFNSKVQDIIKNRYWENKNKIIQLNKDYKKKYSDKISFNSFAIKKLKENINKIDSIIISDYNHDLISNNIIRVIKNFRKTKKIDVYIDKQIRETKEFPKYYNNLAYLVLNQLEFKLLKTKYKLKGDIINSLRNLKLKLKFKNIILKKGKYGSCMIDENSKYYFAKPFISKKIFDVSGAGDHFLAMFASLSNNIDPQKRLSYSNQWANYNLK